jgi:hypothetical protein
VIHDLAVEKIFKDNGLTAYIHGHHHAYYPGKSEVGLRMWSTGALGEGPRILIGTDTVTPRSLMVVEVDDSGKIWVDACAGVGFAHPILRSELPAMLPWKMNVLFRDDES